VTTITQTVSPFTSTEPELVDGFQSSVDSNNIMHTLANGQTRAVFRTASLRKGTMRLVYGADETASRAAELMFAAGEYFELEDADRSSIDGMVFAVSGSIARSLDDDTRDVWVVEVEFEEIEP
jgi:hypothetical protein